MFNSIRNRQFGEGSTFTCAQNTVSLLTMDALAYTKERKEIKGEIKINTRKK